MPAQNSPFVEAKYGWDFGESNWNGGMDENLLKFSFLFDRNIDGIVSTLPVPVEGAAYFLTTDKRLYFSTNGSWFSTVTPKWFLVTMKSTGVVYEFDGTSMVAQPDVIDLDTRLDAVELTISTLGSAAFQNSSTFVGQTEFISTKKNDLLKVVNSIAALKALSKDSFTRVFVSGYYTAGDGGGGEYWYDPSDLTSADNGGTVIVASDLARWKLIHYGEISIKQFGAVADAGSVTPTDNQPMIQKAFDCGVPVVIPVGYFAVYSEVVDKLHRSIRGFGPFRSRIVNKGGTGTYGLRVVKDVLDTWPTTRYSHLSDFGVHGSADEFNYAPQPGNGILVADCNWVLFTNVAAFGLDNCLVIGENAWANRFVRCIFAKASQYCVNDLVKTVPGSGDATETSFVSCNIEQGNVGILVNSLYLKFVDCTIEANTTYDLIANKQVRLLSNYFERSTDGIVGTPYACVDLRDGSYGSQLTDNLFLMNNHSNLDGIRYTQRIIEKGSYFSGTSGTNFRAIKFNGTSQSGAQFSTMEQVGSDFVNGAVTDLPTVQTPGISTFNITTSVGLRGRGGALQLQFADFVPESTDSRSLGSASLRYLAVHGRTVNSERHTMVGTVAAASAPNSTLFVDTADNKLKYKDAAGVVNLLY